MSLNVENQSYPNVFMTSFTHASRFVPKDLRGTNTATLHKIKDDRSDSKNYMTSRFLALLAKQLLT